MFRTFGYRLGSSASTKKIPWVVAVLGAAMVAVCIGSQSAANTITLDATADASLYESTSAADWNYGGQTYSVVGTSGSNSWHTVLKFDLSGLNPATSDGSLKLTFYYDTDFDGYDIAVSEMPLSNADWIEGTGKGHLVAGVTWNNKVGNVTTPVAWVGGSHDYSVTYLASSTFSDGDTSMTLTIDQSKINEWITNGGEASLLLTSPMADSGIVTRLHRIYTKESTTGSPVQLTFTTVPEPSSLLVVVVGLLGIAVVAWRSGGKHV